MLDPINKTSLVIFLKQFSKGSNLFSVSAPSTFPYGHTSVFFLNYVLVHPCFIILHLRSKRTEEFNLTALLIKRLGWRALALGITGLGLHSDSEINKRMTLVSSLNLIKP